MPRILCKPFHGFSCNTLRRLQDIYYLHS